MIVRIVGCLAIVARVAAAEPSNEERAQELYAQGNELYQQQQDAAALDKYRAALALWDHPKIRFNAAVAAIQLDRLLEAADDLEAALRDPTLLAPELVEQGRSFQKLLAGRLGHLELRCDQGGATVSLDGKHWFQCARTERRRVVAGEHVILVEKTAHVPVTRHVVVMGGAVVRERVTLVALADAVRLEYPVARWIPWTVAGGGLALAIGGVATWVMGSKQYDRFEQDLATRCPNGCPADDARIAELVDERDRAKRNGAIGVSLMIAGGAAIVGGITWAVLLNRPRSVLPAIEANPSARGLSVSATWGF